MKKMGKKLLVGLTMALLMTSTAFAAGGWKKNETGWWYATNDAGTTWHANGWQWIDGNNDGTSECYYFDPNGYMLANCKTPDGYTVNADGAWVLDNQVQIKKFASAEYVATKNYNYNYSGSIINTVAPTLIAIRDQEGNLVGEVSRKQDYCHPHDGCMNSYDGIKIQLERGKKYDIDVVMSFYGKGSAINTAERKASMRVEANINGKIFSKRDPVEFYPVSSINQDGIQFKQVLESSASGNIMLSSNRTTAPEDGKFRYVGVAFHAEDFMITDDMPDAGCIYVNTHSTYSGVNDTKSDDTMEIDYSVNEVFVPKINKQMTFSDKYSPSGVNMTIVDMFNATREENAAKYTEVASEVYFRDYDSMYIESEDKTYHGYHVHTVTYANGMVATYYGNYGIRTLKIPLTVDIDPKKIYRYAPEYSEFPENMNMMELENKACGYAEKLGFIPNGYANQYSYNYYLTSLSLGMPDYPSVTLYNLGRKMPYSIMFGRSRY